jgi:GntR family transcriptional regulator / MocR family aminotransferase
MLVCPWMSQPPLQPQTESLSAESRRPEVALQPETDGGAPTTSRRTRRSARAQSSDSRGATLAYMNMTLDKQGALYEQLARALKRAILEGQFAPGSHMPGTRELASMLSVSRNTALAAYELLNAEQLVVARSGSRTRVAHITPMRSRVTDTRVARPPSRYAARARKIGAMVSGMPGMPTSQARYKLQTGEPLLNLRLFNSWRNKVAAAALRTPPGYPPISGLPALRAAVCDYLARRRGFVCSPEDVIIVGGTQQAITIVARTVLDEGEAAIVEDPCYWLARQTLIAHGARLVYVPTDSQGLVTSQLPQPPGRLLYVTPSHQFPTGAVMSLSRRIELLQNTARHGTWILEDDYDGEFRDEARPIAALRSLDGGERVIYVGSFSKSMFPSLRLGYLVSPRSLRDDLLATKRLDDCGCPSIEQAALAAFMQGRQFERHLRHSASELNKRRDTLLEGLNRWAAEHIEVSESRAGMHIVVWLPRLSYGQLDQLIRLAEARGVGVHPVHPCYRERPPFPGLLMGFAGLSCNQIAAATELLGRCLREVAQELV